MAQSVTATWPASIPKVSVVLPAYNEASAIARVVDGVRIAMERSGFTYEIVVVDDASTDSTGDIARGLGARVVRRPARGGSGACRKTGIREARGEIVVMLDADGTYTASDIPRLLAMFPEYDQVNGARTSEQGSLRLLRAPAKWFIQLLARILTGADIPDLNTGFKAFKRDIMIKFLWLIPDGFSCVTTMTMAFLANGFSVAWVPTGYHRRIGKSKFNPVTDTYRHLLTVVRMVMYFNPLKIMLPLGLAVVLVGVLKSIYDRFFVASLMRLQLSDIVILLTGVIIIVLGLMADLIVTFMKAFLSDARK